MRDQTRSRSHRIALRLNASNLAWLLHGVLAGLMVVALRLEDRLWWCACGAANLWSSDVWGAHNSQHLFDPYAFTHVLHGVAFWWLLRLVIPQASAVCQSVVAVLLEGLWEVWENSPFIIDRYRNATAAQGYTGDTVANCLGDLAACVAGFWIARRLGLRRSIVFFLVTEITMALWIRDNLLLNILMLIYPVEAIKQWQAP